MRNFMHFHMKKICKSDKNCRLKVNFRDTFIERSFFDTFRAVQKCPKKCSRILISFRGRKDDYVAG